MKTIPFLFILLALSSNIFAMPGYIADSHDEIIRDSYGGCVHSSYFNLVADTLDQCPIDKATLNNYNKTSTDSVTVN